MNLEKVLKTFEIKRAEDEIIELSVIEIGGKIWVELSFKEKTATGIFDVGKPVMLSFIDYCRVAYRVEEVRKVFTEYFKETTTKKEDK